MISDLTLRLLSCSADLMDAAENKLFIGMIPKEVAEDELRRLFSPFGEIQDLTVLRDNNGESRGLSLTPFSFGH